MKIGRNFTNILDYRYLTEEEKEEFKNNGLKVDDIGFIVCDRMKRDIKSQIDFAKEIGISHIELDGAVPNPFLDFTEDEIIMIKEYAVKNKISLSLHLPYTFVGSAVACLQEEDREMAVALHKRYLNFAGKIGCISAVLHPGGVPFYQTSELYLKEYKNALIKSLCELANFASSKNIKLHLENETVFHNFVFNPEDLLEVVEKVREKGCEIYLNFDIGHWFTVIDGGFSVPENPENVIEKFPEEFLFELHLNDYIPVKKIFHPALHRGEGLLKRENLKRYFQLVKKKKVKLVVIETAVRTAEEILNAEVIIKEEQNFINELLKV